MASVDEDLDGLWAEIEDEFERRGLRVFPAPLLRAPLEPGTWLPARRLADPRKRFLWPMSMPIFGAALDQLVAGCRYRECRLRVLP